MSEKNRSLVTGGAGFIGSELVRQLLQEGEEVVVVDNFTFGRRSNLAESAGLKVVEADLRKPQQLQKVFDRYTPQKVYHMAALHFIPYCLSHPQETLRVNVEGTLNVLEQCKEHQVQVVVFASTAAIYGIGDQPHSEEEPTEPIEIYGLSKSFGEELLRNFHRDTDIPCAVARLFNGYGLRETNPHVIPDILKQLPQSNQVRLGNTGPKRDFVHTADISRALRRMAENGC